MLRVPGRVDLHTHNSADLMADFANPRSETVGVEFTNTVVTSRWRRE